MRLDIEKIQNQRVAVIEVADWSDEKRYRNLFLRQLYAVERFLPFHATEVSHVSFRDDEKFLVITVSE